MVGEALGGLRGEDRARGGGLVQHVRVLDAGGGGSRGRGGRRTDPRARRARRRGTRRAVPAPHACRRAGRRTWAGESGSAGRRRSCRRRATASRATDRRDRRRKVPPRDAVRRKPGFVDSPVPPPCGGPAGENCGSPSIRLASSATAGCSGSSDRMRSRAARASLHPVAVEGRHGALARDLELGGGVLGLPRLLQDLHGVLVAGEHPEHLLGGRDGRVEVVRVEALRGADEQPIGLDRCHALLPRRRLPPRPLRARRRPRRQPDSWPCRGAAAPARTAGPSSG